MLYMEAPIVSGAYPVSQLNISNSATCILDIVQIESMEYIFDPEDRKE